MITKNEMIKMQQTWANAVIEIGNNSLLAKDYVEDLYDFSGDGVLFKPTLAAHAPVRTTYAGTLSYFIGSDNNFSEDVGFALKNWKSVDFNNLAFLEKDQMSFAMGVYHFTDKDGNVVQADYTFGFVRTSDKRIKIKIHHSSFSNK